MYNPFFTADLHLGHANAIKYCNRPFTDAHSMNKAIIENWNDVVGQHDHVYLVGDVSFSGLDQTCSMLDRMHGKKHLIAGNHDHSLRRRAEFQKRFVWIVDYHELTVQDETIKGKKQFIILCHYPLLSWNGARYGSWMIHGHCHGALAKVERNIKRYDCGVDPNNFKPLRYSDLKTIMADKQSVDCDAP